MTSIETTQFFLKDRWVFCVQNNKSTYLNNFSNVPFVYLLVSTAAPDAHVGLYGVPHVHGILVVTQKVRPLLVRLLSGSGRWRNFWCVICDVLKLQK